MLSNKSETSTDFGWFWGKATLALAGLALANVLSITEVRAGVPLVIGSVEEDVKGEQDRYRAFVEYLTDQLAPDYVDRVELTVFTSIDDMARAINRASVDLYIDSPVLATIVGRKADAQPFLRVWKEGVSSYSTVIYARADSGITSVTDLRGRVIAFRKRESTPDHYLPRSFINSQGLRLVELSSPRDEVPGDAIGYVFSHGERTGLAWVQKHIVAASVMKDSAYENADLDMVRKQLTVLAHTDSVPRQVMVRRSGISPELVARLEEVLLTMEDDEDGRAALHAMDETLRIDRFPNGAVSEMAGVRRMLDSVEIQQ